MNKIEFNELVREFGEEIYSFEKFLKDCYITEVSYITLFNSFLKEINILTLENQLIKDSLEKIASGIEIEEVRKFVIEQKQQLTRTIASLVERDNYYKRVYDNTSPYFPNGNKELEDLYHDYCINHHPAVRAIITKPEEEIYNNLKRLYSENEYDAFVKYLEEKKSLFDNREIPQDKYKKNLPKVIAKYILDKYSIKNNYYDILDDITLKYIEIKDNKAYLAKNNGYYEYFQKGNEPLTYYKDLIKA